MQSLGFFLHHHWTLWPGVCLHAFVFYFLYVFLNPPNSDTDYRIFNVHTWSFLCMRVHTGVAAHRQRVSTTFSTQKNSHNFSCAPDGARVWTPGLWILSSTWIFHGKNSHWNNKVKKNNNNNKRWCVSLAGCRWRRPSWWSVTSRAPWAWPSAPAPSSPACSPQSPPPGSSSSTPKTTMPTSYQKLWSRSVYYFCVYRKKERRWRGWVV